MPTQSIMNWAAFLLVLSTGTGVAIGRSTYIKSPPDHPLLANNTRYTVFHNPNGNPVMVRGSSNGPSTNYSNDVKFYLYSRKNLDLPQQVFVNDLSSITASNFDSSKPTKFIIHGYLDNLNSKIIQLNKNQFLTFFDINIIAVDWSALADSILYNVVVREVPLVGQFVGEFMDFLIKRDLVTPARLHIIGHSLGAHVAGLAGRTLQTLGYNVSRVSGLDPALPGFDFSNPLTRLCSSDAKYVDCIHTCGGFLSFDQPICQADFFPNGGTDPQPGCLLIDLGICSHERSYEFFASSINSTNIFPAETCTSVISGNPQGCVSEGALMGYPAGSKKYRGIFYGATTSSYPYTDTFG